MLYTIIANGLSQPNWNHICQPRRMNRSASAKLKRQIPHQHLNKSYYTHTFNFSYNPLSPIFLLLKSLFISFSQKKSLHFSFLSGSLSFFPWFFFCLSLSSFHTYTQKKYWYLLTFFKQHTPQTPKFNLKNKNQKLKSRQGRSVAESNLPANKKLTN